MRQTLLPLEVGKQQMSGWDRHDRHGEGTPRKQSGLLSSGFLSSATDVGIRRGFMMSIGHWRISAARRTSPSQ